MVRIKRKLGYYKSAIDDIEKLHLEIMSIDKKVGDKLFVRLMREKVLVLVHMQKFEEA